MTTGRIDQIIITLIKRRIMDSWSTMMDESKRLQLHLSCLLSFAFCCSTLKNHSLNHWFHYSFFNEYQYQPQTKSLSSSLSSDFNTLTLGPVIKFNQVKESMNQSMTNSTQLNFKNQVKIKLQVKFELTLVIVKRLNMVKLLTVHCSASHERRVLTPNSRSHWFYLIRDHGSDWTSNTNHTEQVETSTGSSSTMPRVLLNCNYSVKLQNLFSSFTFTSLSKSTQAQLLIHSLTHSSTHSNLQTNLKPTS